MSYLLLRFVPVLLQAFAGDPPTTVFLLSVRAGAVGINLTQANNVFLLEPVSSPRHAYERTGASAVIFS